MVQGFKHLDKNDDGVVDLEEVKMWGQELRGRIYTPDEAQKILKSFDVNDDNEITLEEWMEYHENVIPGAISAQSVSGQSVCSQCAVSQCAASVQLVCNQCAVSVQSVCCQCAVNVQLVCS